MTEMIRAMIPVSRELLDDIPPFKLRLYSADEWAAFTDELRDQRRVMDAIGSSPGDKRSLTWRIKRALAVSEFPHWAWESTPWPWNNT